jgi:hypothetical protein
MREAYSLVWSVLVLLFRSRVSLEAEILILRHQLNIQRRHLPKRLTFSVMDRLIFVGLYRLVSSTLNALTIVKPETVVRWHRAGPLWGAPRIHGELLKLGIEIGQTSVAKYMVRRRHPPSQGWRTAEWIANQVTEACGWEQAPRYLIRDRDAAYGDVFIRRLRSIGIRDRPTSPRSPWQNAYAERLIGSIRRECLDHVVVFGERHLRHILLSYMSYHNEIRTHLSLEKDAPISRAVELAGHILCRPILGGLHHNYVRI